MHVADAFGVDFEAMIGRSRRQKHSHSRYAAMLAIQHLVPHATLCETGRTLGDRHHATILAGIEAGQTLRETNRDFARRLANAVSTANEAVLHGQTHAEGDAPPYLSKTPSEAEYRAGNGTTSTDGMIDNLLWWKTNDRRFRAAFVAAHPERAGVR